MKRVLLLLSASMLLTFVNCNKADKSYTGHFYLIHMNGEGPFTLHLNGADRGVLPVFPLQLSCNNDTLRGKALQLQLPAGKYEVEAKDKDGNTVSACSFRFSAKRTSTTGRVAGQSIRMEGECLIVELTD